MKWILITTGVIIVASVGTFAWLSYSTSQAQLTTLERDNAELQQAVLALQTTATAMDARLAAYHQVAAYQEELAHSLRLGLNDSIGDRLVITEAAYEELPKTITEAQTQGYSLLDTVDSEGDLVEAACFAHEGTLHYGKRASRTTDGVEWHGAPFLLTYNTNSEKLLGMVLESTSPQVAPPWEYHAAGHPGMDFSHWSLHLWFTDPPENLSLAHHVE